MKKAIAALALLTSFLSVPALAAKQPKPRFIKDQSARTPTRQTVIGMAGNELQFAASGGIKGNNAEGGEIVKVNIAAGKVTFTMTPNDNFKKATTVGLNVMGGVKTADGAVIPEKGPQQNVEFAVKAVRTNGNGTVTYKGTGKAANVTIQPVSGSVATVTAYAKGTDAQGKSASWSDFGENFAAKSAILPGE